MNLYKSKTNFNKKNNFNSQVNIECMHGQLDELQFITWSHWRTNSLFLRCNVVTVGEEHCCCPEAGDGQAGHGDPLQLTRVIAFHRV